MISKVYKKLRIKLMNNLGHITDYETSVKFSMTPNCLMIKLILIFFIIM